MQEKILITSALLYANGAPHFGHIAGAYLPADCYARFMRFLGHDVLFLSGSDEYGAPITLNAEKAHRSPQEHVDEYDALARKIFGQFNLSFDCYSRTTWKGHEETVLEFFHDLKDNGYLEKKVTSQLYSENENKFLADRYVVGTCPECGYEEARGDECPKCAASFESSQLLNPKSKLTGSKLILKDTEHYFFRLDLLKEPLLKWIKTKNWKAQVLNMAIKYIEDAKARSITRDLNWGIPVPGEKDKVFYVWFDAPIGYISAAKDWAQKKNKPEAWKEFWLDPKTRYVQFVGKDNIPFHSVFFPAMQLGQNTAYKRVDDLPANAFFHYEGKKFSKSDNWFIELDDFFKHYDVDAIRYTLAANAPETSDSEFSWKDFQSKINADLVGKFGNFINRTLVFIQQKAEGKIPALENLEPKDEAFLNAIHDKAIEIKESFEGYHLRQATQKLMELASLCNVYFDEMQPWKLFKVNTHRMFTVLACCLMGVKALAVCAYALMPKTAEKIWSLLGFEDSLIDATFRSRLNLELTVAIKLPKPEILFKKMEDAQVEKELSKLGVKEKPQETQENTIGFDEFLKVDLRVAQIKEVEEVPKSKKLFKLKVDLGDHQRVVVSGIKEHYTQEDLKDKKIILVANLKPAKIMGIESQGMILAGSDGKLLEIPFFQNLSVGSKVS